VIRRFLVANDNKGGKEEQFPLDSIPMFGVIDPGGFAETKLLKRGSRNVIIIGGQPHGSVKKFIVYIDASRVKETQTFIDTWLHANDLWKPRAWWIEVTGPGQYMKKDMERVRTEKKLSMDIIACPSEVSENAKADRITSLIRPFEQGEILLLDGMPGLLDFQAEYRSYPNSTTVDILDAIGWLYRLAWTRQKTEDLNRMNRDRLKKTVDGMRS